MKNNANMIICRNICKAFDGKQVLKDVSVTVPYGSVVAIKGESGIGKTTLLRIIAGLENPDSGAIEGIENKKISFLFQDDRLLPWLSAKKNVEAVIKNKTKRGLATKILTELGLADSLDLYPAQLSGGMKRRVAIARALAYDGDVLILDEALRGLDDANVENTALVIKKYSADKTVITVTHTPSLLEKNADITVNL